MASSTDAWAVRFRATLIARSLVRGTQPATLSVDTVIRSGAGSTSGTVATAEAPAMPFPLQSSLQRALGPATMLSMRALITLSLVFALGCGGSTSASPQDGGGQPDGTNQKDTGTQGDSGAPLDSAVPDGAWGIPSDGGPWSAVCPETAPAVNSSCSHDMLVCEYGDAWWNVACDTVVVCSFGQWTLRQTGGGPCLGKPGPNQPGCPSNSGTIVESSACPEAGLTCNYEQGVVCGCFGSADAGSGWNCQPARDCPTSRPRLGAACSGQQECTYVLCAYSEQCVGNVWQPHEYVCQ
jgi:hypothetical protein